MRIYTLFKTTYFCFKNKLKLIAWREKGGAWFLNVLVGLIVVRLFVF